MPHANQAQLGFQALILCGPGVSLDTFTSNPAEFPKAIVPIANRPMVWYPLDWCYRAGVTNIHVITPPESKPGLEAALSQNPHLTSLPSPKPTILSPEELTNTSSTGDIFRLQEVRDVIVGDFIVLPCDLVCELDGTSLVDEWMVHEAGLGGAYGGVDQDTGATVPMTVGGERNGRRGGLGVWYNTKGEGSVKGEQTDFVAITPMAKSVAPTALTKLGRDISQLVYAIPTDSLNDILEEKKSFAVRHSLLKRFGRVMLKTGLRDAHIYCFPYWVLAMMQNEKLDSVGEDVLGWWAKATWQQGLGEKLGLREILQPPLPASNDDDDDDMNGSTDHHQLNEEVDLSEYISTKPSTTNGRLNQPKTQFASRVRHPEAHDKPVEPKANLVVSPPPMLAYIQPSAPEVPLIRRVDTTPLLLSVSLKLARLPASSTLPKGTPASPLAHPLKIAHPDSIPRQTRIESDNCLLAENVTVEERCNIKESVIGAGCSIGTGARLTKCLLMEGAVVGENVSLTGCVLGARCKVEGGPRLSEDKTDLKDCEVQGGFVVPWGTEAKNEKFMVSSFEGLSDDADDASSPIIQPLEDDGTSHR